jgi:hypothetical protein
MFQICQCDYIRVTPSAVVMRISRNLLGMASVYSWVTAVVAVETSPDSQVQLCVGAGFQRIGRSTSFLDAPSPCEEACDGVDAVRERFFCAPAAPRCMNHSLYESLFV